MFFYPLEEMIISHTMPQERLNSEGANFCKINDCRQIKLDDEYFLIDNPAPHSMHAPRTATI